MVFSSIPNEISRVMSDEVISVSIIIPVYNEEESLPILLVRLTEVMEEVGEPYELIFIDDGSSDASLYCLRNSCDSIPQLRVIELRRNFGKSAALAAGFAVARGQILVTMDADLQDEPHEIPRMLAKIREGYDLVSGWKMHRHDPLSKTIPSRIANLTTALLTGVRVRDMNSGFKCYRSELTKQIPLYGDLHRYIPILAHTRGFRITEIPVVHHPRQYGKSKYGISRLLHGMFDLLTVLFISNYRNRPLHLFGSMGLLLGLLGFGINAYLAVLWFMGHSLSNRPLLMLGMLLIIVGVQFVSMGLTAELTVSHNYRLEDPLAIIREIHDKASLPVR